MEPEKKPARKRNTKPNKVVDVAIANQNITTKTEFVSSPVELPEEVASRLRRQDSREAHELFKEKTFLMALLVVTGCVVAASLGVLLLSNAPNLQNWATAAWTSTLAGYFGWFTGKQAK